MLRTIKNLLYIVLLTTPLITSLNVNADTKQDVAKEIANPLTSMTMIPIQISFDQDIGSLEGDRTTMNIQPLTSFELNDNWDVISRTIVPLISQEDTLGFKSEESGLGDITQSFFFSPKMNKGDAWTWGVGPVLTMPTATEDYLGVDHIVAGITGVAAKTDGPWTFGLLSNYMQSVDNSSNEAEVEIFYIQPFFDYTTEGAVTWELTTEATYDMKAEEWSIPLILTANKIVEVSDFMMAFGGGPRYWIESPDYGPQGWSFNLSVYFFFTK